MNSHVKFLFDDLWFKTYKTFHITLEFGVFYIQTRIDNTFPCINTSTHTYMNSHVNILFADLWFKASNFASVHSAYYFRTWRFL